MNQDRLNDEIGEILTIENGSAVVLFDRHAACARCKACGIFAENQKKVSIKLPAPENVRIGDHVRLIVNQRYYTVSLLLLYGLPCISLVLGIVAGILLFGKNGQLWAALMGIGLTALTYFVIKSQDQKLAEWKKGKLEIQKVEEEPNKS